MRTFCSKRDHKWKDNHKVRGAVGYFVQITQVQKQANGSVETSCRKGETDESVLYDK
jgi:hypothetical protein